MDTDRDDPGTHGTDPMAPVPDGTHATADTPQPSPDGPQLSKNDSETPRDLPGSSVHAAEYSYGEAPPPDTAPGLGNTGEREASPGPDGSTAEREVSGQDTGLYSSTGVRTGTAPRAVLRPVPDGFPTPPPRPARPNRAPALKQPDPEPDPRPRWLVPAIAAGAVVLLVLGILGGVFTVRALTDQDPAGTADPVATGSADPSGDPAGEVAIGGVTVREVSTEPGVRGVGDTSTRIEPEGEFVVVTIEVVNDTANAIILTDHVRLETADGTVHERDPEASSALVADSEASLLLSAGDTGTLHVVYDVPVGSDPVAAQIDLTKNPEAGEGTLPLGG